MLTLSRTALALAALAAGASAFHPLMGAVKGSTPSIVHTPSGTLQGFVDDANTTKIYLGVPFAQPPVGDLRWRSPVPMAPWSGVRTATWYNNSCPQSSDAFTILTNMDEDCLYLNIWVPTAAPPPGGFPVMLFFFGGSWNEGSGSFLLYAGESDVTLTENVIMVTTNYRLNVFGFVSSDQLRAEDPSGSTGNYGIQDQRLAMQWVQKNIAAFGGNPQLVTIFGESAGAGSVSGHLVNPRSKGLFQRAIMESGPIAAWTVMPYNYSAVKWNVVSTNLGCSNTSDVLACMRSKSTAEVRGALFNLPDGFLQWGPTIDGVEFTDTAENLAKKGQFNNVPVLLGTNEDEGTLFVHASKTINDTGAYNYLVQTFGALGEQMYAQYPPASYASPWWSLTHAFGDSQMTCAARRTARWANAAGNNVYVYFYTHVNLAVSIFEPYYGVFHGSELINVFNFDLIMLGPGEADLGKQFVRYWTRFAATGNPNGDSDPSWPTYSASSDLTMNLDVGSGTNATSGLRKAQCDWWDTITIPDWAIWGQLPGQPPANANGKTMFTL